MKQGIYSNKAEVFPQKRLLNQSAKAAIKSFLFSSWQQFSSIFTPQNEPRVWQTKRDGKTIWHGYDPSTGRKATCFSEKEMLIWLEERYYQ